MFRNSGQSPYLLLENYFKTYSHEEEQIRFIWLSNFVLLQEEITTQK